MYIYLTTAIIMVKKGFIKLLFSYEKSKNNIIATSQNTKQLCRANQKNKTLVDNNDLDQLTKELHKGIKVFPVIFVD